VNGFRSKFVVALVGVGLLAGCAQAGTTPAPAATWQAGVAPHSPSAKPKPATKPKPKPRASTAPGSTPPESTPPGSTPPGSTPHFGGPAGSMTRTGGSGVALTFDDGPDPVQTPRILDLLAEYHVRATFCLVGRNVEAYPELVRRIVAGGHTLCNHSWQHSLTLGKQSPDAIRADLQRTNDAIHAAAPGAKIAYLRAPGGNFTPAYVQVATAMGMKSIYWQVDPRDWDHPAGESSSAHRAKVIAAVETHTRKGSIVLSHDYGQPDTIAAYQTLIPWLQARFHLIALGQ